MHCHFSPIARFLLHHFSTLTPVLVLQLDRLIEDTEKEYAGTELPSEVTRAQVMLREHEANHERINQLIGLSHNEGEQIVVRVRQKVSGHLVVKQ